jgi:beta-lactam-binding protein with PASTA domain
MRLGFVGVMGILVLAAVIVSVAAVWAFICAVSPMQVDQTVPLVQTTGEDVILVTHYGEWGKIDHTIEASRVEKDGETYVITDKHSGKRYKFYSDISVEVFYGWTAKNNDSN